MFSFLTQLHIVPGPGPGVSPPSGSVPGGLCLYAVTASTFLTLHSPLSKHLCRSTLLLSRKIIKGSAKVYYLHLLTTHASLSP